jgi:hypothetical protein
LGVRRLELAPGAAFCGRRLPWFHRASPSTTQNEFRCIKSTNTDRLIDTFKNVKRYLCIHKSLEVGSGWDTLLEKKVTLGMRTVCRAQALLVGLLLFVCASVRANVYATDIRLNGSLNAGVLVPGSRSLTISYVLNDDATGGVSLLIYSGTNVVKTFAAAGGNPGATAGLNSIHWDGATDGGSNAPPGVYTVAITAAAEGYGHWTCITDDSTNYSVFFPTAITVNKNTNSPYYGRVFIGNGVTGGDPQVAQGILKCNADGSPAEEGPAPPGGYPWTPGGFFYNPSPWKMSISADDKLYVDDWSAGGVLISFDQVLSTNYLPVLRTDNYPYQSIYLSGPSVQGAGTNTQILMADIDVASSGGLGVLRWNLTSNGTLATNDTGTVVVGLSANSDLSAAPFDMAQATNGNIYVIQRIDEYSPIYPIDNVAAMRVLCFPPYPIGGPPGTKALWQAGGNNSALENAYGVAVNPPGTLLAVASRGQGSDSTSLEFGGISIFNATNGALVANMNQDLQGNTNQQVIDVAWDNVGNLYAAEWTESVWRIYSPPGPNQATTTAAPIIQAFKSLLPPVLSHPVGVPGQVGFSLQGQSNVTYVIQQSSDLLNWLPVATNYSAVPNRFLIVPCADTQDFYRAVVTE